MERPSSGRGRGRGRGADTSDPRDVRGGRGGRGGRGRFVPAPMPGTTSGFSPTLEQIRGAPAYGAGGSSSQDQPHLSAISKDPLKHAPKGPKAWVPDAPREPRAMRKKDQGDLGLTESSPKDKGKQTDRRQSTSQPEMPVVPLEPKIEQGDHHEYLFGQSRIISDDVRTERFKTDLRRAWDELAAKFRHREFRSVCHGLPVRMINDIVLGLSETQVQELGKALQINLAGMTQVEQLKELCSLPANTFIGPSKESRYQATGLHKLDATFIEIEGTKGRVQDPRSGYLAPIYKMMDNIGHDVSTRKIQPNQKFTNEQFSIIKSGLVAADRYHYALVGERKLDLDLGNWTKVDEEGRPFQGGKKWKKVARIVSREEIDKILNLPIDTHDIDLKALASYKTFFDARQLAGEFHPMLARFTPWKQLQIDQQGGLPPDKAKEMLGFIDSYHQSLSHAQLFEIGEAVYKRTGQAMPQTKERFDQMMHEYAEAFLQTFIRKKEGDKTLPEQYADEFLEKEEFKEEGEFKEATIAAFKKSGEPSGNRIYEIRDAIMKNIDKSFEDKSRRRDFLLRANIITKEEFLAGKNLKPLAGERIEAYIRNKGSVSLRIISGTEMSF